AFGRRRRVMTGPERTKWVIVTAAMLVMAWAAVPAAHAQGPGGGKGWRGGWGGGLMLGVPLHVLNLTPDQQNQARSVLSSYRTSARPIIQQLRQAQSDLGTKLLTAGPVQSADLQPQIQQIGQLRAQLLQLSAQATADIRNLLTPAQIATAAQTREKLKDLQSQMHQLLAPPQTPAQQ